MALRIAPSVLSGALDFTVRGLVTGHLDVIGRDEPILLHLEGLPWPDLAGHRLSFRRAEQAGDTAVHEAFDSGQSGPVGDMTASRKVKVPDRPIAEIVHLPASDFTWHWGNCLYLEWHSVSNGRVVLESTDYELTLDPVGAWQMGPKDQPGGAQKPLFPFSLESDRIDDFLPFEDDGPKSEAEAEADRDAARMDRLLDRITRRMEMEGEEADYALIMEEERARLRAELGEPDPEPLTPEEEAERDRWIEEMNAASQEHEDSAPWEIYEHPLVTSTADFGERLWRDLIEGRGIDEGNSPEHPLLEIANGVMFAGVKLSGALDRTPDESWPPDPLFAGDILVRLKKARGHLHDALAGLRSAENDDLLRGVQLDEIEREVRSTLESVEILITEVRKVLG